ncbi:hypothetical protein [Aquimarina algiphila]|uniref:Uncharacterized protein n=1 Tax=Aquimarina algiphila TaxID=2047982 RepID=A0A554VFW5_9FLAO|nr:hypothetical protein [Aquimarina algiphila]TSE06217.1 hypothetical protein FOF46_20180 [Aquimarina algiphila]
MRKLLLFIFVTSLFVVESCSKHEEYTEVSLTEKEYLVEQTLIEFNNSAIKTGKYDRLINSISQKSTTESLSQAELEVMLQEFLGEQTQAFLSVYYQLEALGITAEEFYSIAHQFEYLRLDISSNGEKKSGNCSGGPASLLSAIINWFSGCDKA